MLRPGCMSSSKENVTAAWVGIRWSRSWSEPLESLLESLWFACRRRASGGNLRRNISESLAQWLLQCGELEHRAKELECILDIGTAVWGLHLSCSSHSYCKPLMMDILICCTVVIAATEINVSSWPLVLGITVNSWVYCDSVAIWLYTSFKCSN